MIFHFQGIFSGVCAQERVTSACPGEFLFPAGPGARSLHTLNGRPALLGPRLSARLRSRLCGRARSQSPASERGSPCPGGGKWQDRREAELGSRTAVAGGKPSPGEANANPTGRRGLVDDRAVCALHRRRAARGTEGARAGEQAVGPRLGRAVGLVATLFRRPLAEDEPLLGSAELCSPSCSLAGENSGPASGRA